MQSVFKKTRFVVGLDSNGTVIYVQEVSSQNEAHKVAEKWGDHIKQVNYQTTKVLKS